METQHGVEAWDKKREGTELAPGGTVAIAHSWSLKELQA